MAEMPWFPMWATDFVNARTVRTMTPEQVGVYILLLCHEWNDGPLPDDNDALRVLANMADADAVRTVLERCFLLTEDGEWVNERLEEVREEQEAKREDKVRAGKLSAKARRRKKLEQRSSTVAAPLERSTNKSESESDTEGELQQNGLSDDKPAQAPSVEAPEPDDEPPVPDVDFTDPERIKTKLLEFRQRMEKTGTDG